MRVYIIHPDSKSENYIDKVLVTEQMLIKEGHHVVNPYPDQKMTVLSNEEMYQMYANKIEYADMVYAMEGWDKPVTGNKAMSKAMILRKTIRFEQKV